MKNPKTARINGKPIALLPKETVLQAALRSGIDFPNSCRVGGCATCKCRLTEGQVKERTETGYLLSAEEIERGYILACQSVPESDVHIEVDLTAQTGTRVKGRVVEQTKVTADITHVAIRLDGPIDYRAGQFAQVSFDELPDVHRTYSFASPPSKDGLVEFFVRRVAGGQLSPFVNDRDVRGAAVRVSVAAGDFWLRPGKAPLVMVAGGSGLAPILAMLEEAAAAGDARRVTLLFGAREERDLYALERIMDIARTWKGDFRFVPVLSAEPSGSTWTGQRGLVADQIPAFLEPGAHAYVCGPPAMVDAAVERLRERNVPREHVFFDRFTTRADDHLAAIEPLAPTGEGVLRPASVFDYLKYCTFHVLGLLAAAALIAGGWYVSAALAALLGFYVIGDAVSGDDIRTPVYRHPGVLTAQLWLALPLLVFIVFVSVWSVCPTDPLAFGAWASALTGHDVLVSRAATSFGQHVAGWVLTGLMIGMIGTIPAHELTHRTWDPVSMFVGRWLLAFSFDTSFAIEHVYGHHRYVSTREDPATATRGRNVYAHIVLSTVKGNVSASKIEALRLRKRRLGVFSLHNAYLRGHSMSLLLVAIAWAMGGLRAAAYFAVCALLGKALLEVVNYMEHYGMVRNPARAVAPRHSWNTNRRVSSWALFNLTRHSHHHAQGEVPYQDLRPYPDAPMMISGYLSTLIVALVPPLWHRLMTPRVLAWDRDHATAEERALAAEANARSGRADFMAHGAGETPPSTRLRHASRGMGRA